MGNGINAARQTAHHRKSGLCQLVSQPVGSAQAVTGAFARADHSQRVAVLRQNLSAHIQRQRRIMNRFERIRIFVIKRRNNMNTQRFSLFDLRLRIDLRALRQNGFRKFFTNSFNHPKVGMRRIKNSLR